MHASLSAAALLALVAGTFLPSQASKWDASFDYTNLPPSNQELWTPLAGAEVALEQALAAAQEAEGAPVRPLTAEMRLGEGAPQWHLQLFVGEPGSTPRRVNLRVSAAEPKVEKRFELRELLAQDLEVWALLSQASVTPEIAIGLGRERATGDKAEAVQADVRARKLVFVAEERQPMWKLEVMGRETKNDLPRRTEFQIRADQPTVKQRLLLDRFAGEPLRADEAIRLDNGLWIHDFKVGEGEEVQPDARVEVNYRLFLLDTQKIHDTVKGKKSETFVVSQAPLKGMTLGMQGMRVGGKRKIVIPHELAFGPMGNEIAPPRAMVVCDLVVESLVSD